MNRPSLSVVLARGDYLGYVVPLGLTPLGELVVGWSVQDMTDLEQRAPFAFGQAVGAELGTLECANAARQRMALSTGRSDPPRPD